MLCIYVSNAFLNIFGKSVSKIKFHYNLTIITGTLCECLCILWLYCQKLFLKFEFFQTCFGEDQDT